MGYKFVKSKFAGVRYKEHPTRKNGIRKDRYFVIRYQLSGKAKQEGIGWESEGFSELKAYELLCEIKQNIKTGQGVFSLREKRQEEERQRKEAKENEETEKVRNVTFDEFYERIYIPNYLMQKSPKTYQNENGLYQNHIKAILGDKKLADITPLDVEKIKIAMSHRAAETIKHSLALVRQVFNCAKTAGIYFKDNPVSAVKKPKADNRRMRFLTKEEAGLLLDELQKRSQTLYEMAYLSLYTGLRAGEVFKLKWVDIDFEGKKIAVRDTKSSVNRYAYMTDKLLQILKDRYGVGQNLDSYVFTGTDKNAPITEISNSFDRTVKAVGLNEGITDRRQKVVFHTLRHTFASWLVQAGIDLYQVQNLMGHSNITMTQRYSHLAPDNFTRAVAVLEDKD